MARVTNADIIAAITALAGRVEALEGAGTEHKALAGAKKAAHTAAWKKHVDERTTARERDFAAHGEYGSPERKRLIKALRKALGIKSAAHGLNALLAMEHGLTDAQIAKALTA
jgi:hypothetical protein